ncbi:MAG: hypothetical protein R3181_14295 [Rubricoccaceae bacterium]|nr:hypothetical protein [Rubricoccaceae bacterium]
MKRLRLLPALVLLAPLALVGCDDADPDPGIDPGSPPPVLAADAFAFDGTFPEEGGQGARGAFGQNWWNASLRVGIVSLGVGVHLIIPSAATAAAGQADPYVEDGTWVWESTFTVNTSDITYRLEATPDGTEIEWRMLISSDDLGSDGYDAFELYDATTALDGESGSWRLYYEIDGERTRVLEADFEVTGADARELTFTIPETNPNEDARGSTVRYVSDGDERLFDWHQEPEDYDHLVEWNAETQVGAITATNYLDGGRYCWDEDLEDAPCD